MENDCTKRTISFAQGQRAVVKSLSFVPYARVKRQMAGKRCQRPRPYIINPTLEAQPQHFQFKQTSMQNRDDKTPFQNGTYTQ